VIYERLKSRFLEANQDLKNYLKQYFPETWQAEFANQSDWLIE
jgi:hypothetical protein